MSIKLSPEARTALKHLGGPTELAGDPALSQMLSHAFEVGGEHEGRELDAEAARAHVHGFHSYPARMHPLTASRLVVGLTEPGQTVLDPFCGSGTVLVEARLLGRAAQGTDVNPLAIRLTNLKVRGVPASERDALVAAARFVEGHTTKRRAAHLPPTREYGPEDSTLFDPHVLRELDSIRDGIDRVEPPALRRDLELVFSAILTKMSRKQGDSGLYLRHRRLAPGFCARFFVQKSEELARSLATFESRLPKDAPPAEAHADDAAVLGTIKAGSVHAVISSPPYAGTYDYLDHHDVRLRWLRLRTDRFADLELGARRDYNAERHPGAALARWRDELGRTLSAIMRTLAPSGRCVLVLADSAVLGRALRADEIVRELADGAGLRLLATASQSRPHFHGATARAFTDKPRREHLLLLGRSDG